MKLPEMKTGLTISAVAHALLLVWGLISFAGKPLEAKPNDGMPVDIISDKQFSEITKGIKTGEKDKPPAPLVDKVGEIKPAEDAKAKVNEKREIKSTKVEAAPPPPPEPKPDPKQAKKEPPKPDPIAETLKKEEAKKPQQQPPKPAPQFDPTKIAALLDKRESQRLAATGAEPNANPSMGYVGGAAMQITQGELDALRERLKQCWNPPAGAMDGGRLKVVIRVLFKQDGSVAQAPQLVMGTPSAFGPAMAESAIRAILTCQPFKMLKPEHYKDWKDIEITFDPREMFGG
jgi:colicin import membrane protein